MIAANYIKFPEALRFQREMFSNGYHNSPRIMRLMTVIFEWKEATPDWWTVARAKAKALAKAVKTACFDWVNSALKSADIHWWQEKMKKGGHAAHIARFKLEKLMK